MSFNMVINNHYYSKPHEAYDSQGNYTFRSTGSYGTIVGHSSLLDRINREISDATSDDNSDYNGSSSTTHHHHHHREHNNIFEYDKNGNKIYASEVARAFDQRHNYQTHNHHHRDEYRIGDLLSGKTRHNYHNEGSRLGRDYW